MSEWEEFAAYLGIIRDAKREERERIVNLLENNCHKYTEGVACPCGAPMPEQVDYIIELIKE